MRELIIRESNNMSLSCKGVLLYEDGVIKNLSFKGYPRTNGDEWTYFFNRKIGNTVSDKDIEELKSYNGRYNVVVHDNEVEGW